MIAKIVKDRTTDAGDLFIEVEFYARLTDLEPDFYNSFEFRMPNTITRAVRDEFGRYQRESDGVWIDPESLASDRQPKWVMETVDFPVRAHVMKAIDAYVARRQKKETEGVRYPKDDRDRRGSRLVDADSKGQRSAIADLKDVPREVSVSVNP